jgi:hypothetical protein
VPDLAGAEAGWGRLGPAAHRAGLGALPALVVEESPALSARVRDRRAPGLNHDAAQLEDRFGYEVELVAGTDS